MLYEGQFLSDASVPSSVVKHALVTDADVAEKAKELMSLPPLRELDLPESTGKPAQRLLKKLELAHST